MRQIGAATLLLLGLFSVPFSGCMCDSEKVEFDVDLTRSEEIVRTLPMLVSEGTRIAGVPIPVPDSHGFLDLKVDVPHPNITQVNVADFRASLEVDGRDLPVRVVAIDGETRWREQRENRTWSGGLEDGETIRLWWAVDRQRADFADLVLKEGAPYRIRFTFEWDADDCSFAASGDVDETFNGIVRASVNAKTFQRAGTPHIDPQKDHIGFRANYAIKSGVSVNLDSSSGIAVVLSKGELSAAVMPKVSWTVNGLPGSAVKAGDTLATFSASTTSPATYARSGAVLPTGSIAPESLVIVVQDLTYRATDGSLGTVADGFAFARAT